MPPKIQNYNYAFLFYDDIVNIGLHFILKNVRPYAASCSEAQYCCRLTIGGNPPVSRANPSVIPIADEVSPDEGF